MKLLAFLAPLPLLLVGQAVAQNALFGAIERDPAGAFLLAHTNLPFRTKQDLGPLVGQDLLLKVADVGGPKAPLLELLGYAPAKRMFTMGDLVIDQPTEWGVYAQPMAQVFVAFGLRENTGFVQLAPAGVFLLGADAQVAFHGLVDVQGTAKFAFVVPHVPQLIGVAFTGQALVIENGFLCFTEVDGKTVKPPVPH